MPNDQFQVIGEVFDQHNHQIMGVYECNDCRRRIRGWYIPDKCRCQIPEEPMATTLKEFKKLSGWTESLDRFAYEAAKVEDDEELAAAGKAYIEAENALLTIMEQLGVEMG